LILILNLKGYILVPLHDAQDTRLNTFQVF
jgi:hypothetical protein